MSSADAVVDQFDLIWALADLHLTALTEDDFLWEPAEVSWSVRPDAMGVWRPDWSDAEPDPIPVPTIGWLSWHIDWWWSTALDHLDGRPPRAREDVVWPGTGEQAVARLHELAAQWRRALTGLIADDLQRPSSFPWPPDAGRTVEDTALWVNVELTKNVSEIGQLRLIRAASPL
ncbi:DinB family protein [Mycobacterium sp. URHB0044]|uniref:DinB family protein n=1 Tax=Mycobacterium sp. URHB0044 TaxID=1380386 RepID=UPI00048FB094|nr:DinB family protein [Mycobacterium sp. URHB0044]